MEKKENYPPLGSKDPEWIRHCNWLVEMRKLGSDLISSQVLKHNPNLAERDFTKPETFTDEEVWEYYSELIDNE